MSLAAIFVFLLVSAVQMLECVLDLARRVGATNVLFFPCPRSFSREEKIRLWAD